MSRFSNLEFDSQSDGEARLQGGERVKDEAFFLESAQAAFEQGDFERGLRAYSKVLEHNPQNTRAWSGQVRMLIELGEYSEAKLWADKALERFPHDPELLAAKAVALARTGDLTNALAFSDAAFEERGDTPYIWLARGDVLLARGEARSDYCFDKALSLAPGQWFVRWLVSRVHFYYKRFASALKLAQEALTLDAARAVLWLQLSLCQVELGLVDSAGISIGHAMELDPRIPGAKPVVDRVAQSNPLGTLFAWIRRPFTK